MTGVEFDWRNMRENLKMVRFLLIAFALGFFNCVTCARAEA